MRRLKKEKTLSFLQSQIKDFDFRNCPCSIRPILRLIFLVCVKNSTQLITVFIILNNLLCQSCKCCF